MRTQNPDPSETQLIWIYFTCATACGCMGGGPEVTGVEQLSGTMEGSGMYGLRGRRPSKLFWATAEGATAAALTVGSGADVSADVCEITVPAGPTEGPTTPGFCWATLNSFSTLIC